MEVPEQHKNNSCQKTLCNRCPVQLGLSFPNCKNLRVIILGHKWNTVSRVLFRKRELTEFSPNSLSPARNSVSSVWQTIQHE